MIGRRSRIAARALPTGVWPSPVIDVNPIAARLRARTSIFLATQRTTPSPRTRWRLPPALSSRLILLGGRGLAQFVGADVAAPGIVLPARFV